MKPIWFLSLLAATCFAPYVSSWSGVSAGSVGGILRDVVLLTSVGMSLRVMKNSDSSRILFTFFGLLILYSIGCIVLSGYPQAELIGCKTLLVVLAYPMVAARWARSKLSQTAVVGILLIGMICALLGIFDVATNGLSLDLLGYRVDYGGSSERYLLTEHYGADIRRATGGLGDALNYGYVMGIFTMYFLANTTHNQSSKLTGLYLTCAAICALATVLSVTRGAVLGLIAGALVLLGTRLKYLLLFLPLIFAAVGVVVITIPEVNDIIIMRIVRPDDLAQESSQLRIYMLQEALVLMRENPWGLGLGSQGVSVEMYGRGTPNISDNAYMIFILEAGWVGAALIMAVVITGFVVLVKDAKGSSLLTVLAFGLFWSISAGLSGALTSSMPSGVFWLLLASCVALKNQGNLQQKPANGVRAALL